MEREIRAAGRIPMQRTTLYGEPPAERHARALGAAPLTPVIQTRPKRRDKEILVTHG